MASPGCCDALESTQALCAQTRLRVPAEVARFAPLNGALFSHLIHKQHGTQLASHSCAISTAIASSPWHKSSNSSSSIASSSCVSDALFSSTANECDLMFARTVTQSSGCTTRCWRLARYSDEHSVPPHFVSNTSEITSKSLFGCSRRGTLKRSASWANTTPTPCSHPIVPRSSTPFVFPPSSTSRTGFSISPSTVSDLASRPIHSIVETNPVSSLLSLKFSVSREDASRKMLRPVAQTHANRFHRSASLPASVSKLSSTQSPATITTPNPSSRKRQRPGVFTDIVPISKYMKTSPRDPIHASTALPAQPKLVHHGLIAGVALTVWSDSDLLPKKPEVSPILQYTFGSCVNTS